MPSTARITVQAPDEVRQAVLAGISWKEKLLWVASALLLTGFLIALVGMFFKTLS